ncbi:MAG: aminotransferase class III-fold pyridoxal phosphate-dependent enzyme, partial [SAR324 cluster bacterium]|nr:aminotransferase class III-fold pyridoxal phosphate-dependent enzyme [SAR324 cluster bacterium]
MMSKEEILKNNLDYTLFSWGPQGGISPVSVERAEGVYLYDRDGKRIIDFSSQLMNVNIGHGNKKIQDAVYKQMSELSYVFPGMATEARGKLGKKLAAVSPGSMKKTFFTNAGAEAIENAIKLARMVTGRQKIITKYRSYHGATYGAVAAGGDPRKFPVDRDG